jgi:hypothetical protein
MSIFGPIFVGHDLEMAALETLRAWFPTYLREVELQQGLPMGEIPSPRTYTTRNEFTSFPEDQMPICVVVSPGLAGEPHKEGNGTISGWFSLGVGVLASAATEEDTNYLSKMYGAAIRAIMVQQGDLGGMCSGIDMLDESYDDVPDIDQTRSIRAAQWVGLAYIDHIVDRTAGPIGDPDPETQPGSEWPEITTGSISVKKKEA